MLNKSYFQTYNIQLFFKQSYQQIIPPLMCSVRQIFYFCPSVLAAGQKGREQYMTRLLRPAWRWKWWGWYVGSHMYVVCSLLVGKRTDWSLAKEEYFSVHMAFWRSSIGIWQSEGWCYKAKLLERMYETGIFLSQIYEVTSFVMVLLEAEPRCWYKTNKML